MQFTNNSKHLKFVSSNVNSLSFLLFLLSVIRVINYKAFKYDIRVVQLVVAQCIALPSSISRFGSLIPNPSLCKDIAFLGYQICLHLHSSLCLCGCRRFGTRHAALFGTYRTRQCGSEVQGRQADLWKPTLVLAGRKHDPYQAAPSGAVLPYPGFAAPAHVPGSSI